MINPRPPRVRPLALAALAMVTGLLVGLDGSSALLLPVALFALLLGTAALLAARRDALVVASLLSVLAAGMVLGDGEVRRAARDCRRGWKAGEEIRVTGVAIGFLSHGERGSVRLRPSQTGPVRRCGWVGSLRVWTDGPVGPGASYVVSGSWRLSSRPRWGARPPERRGWIVADEMELIAPSRFRRHPFLALRGALAERIWEAYPRRWAPLALALVLGQRESLDPEVIRRIGRAGLAHLLAISGLHVGMLAGAFFFLARGARLSLEGSHLVTLGLVCGYVLVIGAPASAVRAAVMIILWTLTRLAGRASSPFDVLGLTALLLLSARPWSVVEPGFQLSFAGAAAVGYAHREARRARWMREWPSVARAALVGALTSAAAVLLTAPITAAHFGRVTPAAVLGNLVAIPLLGLAMPPLYLSALLSWQPGLASWPVGAAIVLLQGIDAVAGLLGSLRWAAVEVARPGLWPMAVYVVLLVMGAHALYGAWQRRRFILSLGLAWSLAIVWPALQGQFSGGRLGIYVLDVGQGDAIAVRTPGRRWLLIDAGPSIGGFDAGARRVVPFLRAHGVRRLEAWLATHPDLDHVGGGPAVLEAIEVERVIGVGRVTGQIGQIAVLRQLVEDSQVWMRAVAGARLALDGVELAFLHPEEGAARDATAAANEQSLVFRLEFGDFRMLFTGDVLGEVEDRLSREQAEEVAAQVLKIAHHGSATSTSRLFLNTVRPRLAVICVGRGNRYGHPAPQVLRRLALQHVEVRRTDRDGMLVIEAERDGSFRVRSAAEFGW